MKKTNMKRITRRIRKQELLRTTKKDIEGAAMKETMFPQRECWGS
jgi:hypothetical protein